MTPIVVFDSSLKWQTCFVAWHGGCLQPPFISFGDYGLRTVNIQLATALYFCHAGLPLCCDLDLPALFFATFQLAHPKQSYTKNQNITSRNKSFSIFSTTVFQTKELGHLPIPVASRYHCHQYQGLGKPDRNHQPMIEDTEN